VLVLQGYLLDGGGFGPTGVFLDGGGWSRGLPRTFADAWLP